MIPWVRGSEAQQEGGWDMGLAGISLKGTCTHRGFQANHYDRAACT